MTKKDAAVKTEELSGDECWKLLRGVSVGRLAVWFEGHPDIFPINYTVDHGTLVFRTGEGTKLAALRAEHPVAMEADGVDAETGIAWSVVAKGTVTAMTSIGDMLDSFSLMLFPWQSGQKDHFMRISPSVITGRRFKVAPPDEWWTAHSGAPRSFPE